ncbi:hypothetical protein [Niabella aquatica]
MGSDIFKGIERSEIESFGKRLDKESALGNRFAAIQIKGDSLLEQDMAFCRTPFEATRHIFLAPTANGFYMLCSMSSLEKDVKQILEGKVIEIEQEAGMKKEFDIER